MDSMKIEGLFVNESFQLPMAVGLVDFLSYSR